MDEFVVSFSPSTSCFEIVALETNKQDLQNLSQQLGIPCTTVVTTLGITFPLSSEPIESACECQKVVDLIEKLRRIEHLPVPFHVKREAISVGVLSTLDYGGPISPTDAMPMRLSVKKALGVARGAPEVIFYLTGKGTVDPVARWFPLGLTHVALCQSTRKLGT